MSSCVLRNVLKFISNESHKNIPEGLPTVLGCLHNVFVMYLSYLIIVSL
jgi:hypothetical protein